MVLNSINAMLNISTDRHLLQEIKDGYINDPWCKRLPAATPSWPELHLEDSLWYVGNRLIIPHTGTLCETLFQLAHDTLGHFGFDKTYGSLQTAYYWPNTCRDLENGYVASCPECQHNKSSMVKPIGPLHPLPIPDQQGDSVAIDFIGPLPEDDRNNCIITFTDHLGSNIQLAATQTDITADQLAYLFFDKWYCENGLPSDIISDRDKLFISKFWKALHKITSVKLRMSTAYHPQMDGASERTNKTVNQCLWYHVEHNQLGWSHTLPQIHFHIMNTINKSTGFTPFQLRMGRNPQLIPPLLPLSHHTSKEDVSTCDIIERLQTDVTEAQDNLLHAKISQSIEANKHCSILFPFTVGSRVCLTTLHRCNKYKAKAKNASQNLCCIMMDHTPSSMLMKNIPVTIELPNTPNIFPTFHTSEVLPFVESDTSLFPSHKFNEPLPILTPEGEKKIY